MKKYYDHKTDYNIYSVGTPVWFHNQKQKRGLSCKLQREWRGPFIMTHRLNDVIYRIRETRKSKPKSVHQNKIYWKGNLSSKHH
jgi:hypothetical protein